MENKPEIKIAKNETSISNQLMKDERFKIDEEINIDESSNEGNRNRKETNEAMNSGDGDEDHLNMMSKDKDHITVMPMIKQENVGSSSNLISRTDLESNNRAKILASARFSDFFFKQAGRTYKIPDEFSSVPKKKHVSKSGDLKTYDETLINGISLREWLQTDGSDARMFERLRLFMKIVQLVEAAHSKGIVFLELRPSSFVLLPDGDVRYVGSFTGNGLSSETNQQGAKKRVRFGSDDLGLVKKQRLFLGEDKEVKREVSHETDQLEKMRHGFAEGPDAKDLIQFNVYCLGLLLFELCCRFESLEVHSAAMMELHHQILPPCFLSESPTEAELCFRLLHPEPSSRPTVRMKIPQGLTFSDTDTSIIAEHMEINYLRQDILQWELIYGSENMHLDYSATTSFVEEFGDVESDLLLHFLVSVKEHKQNRVFKLLESIALLDVDIKEVERRNASRGSLDCSRSDLNLNEYPSLEILSNTSSGKNALREKLLTNINQLDDAYFCMRSNIPHTEMPDMDRSDKDLLTNHVRVPSQDIFPALEEKSIDHVGAFFDGICKFSRYKKFEVYGTLRNGDNLNSDNAICALSFDREEEYIAAAGISKKIKIFEFHSLLNDSIDVQYPVLEMTSNSKFSCVCWNNYIKNYLASTDYDGVVQVWDASSGQEFVQYKEHRKRAWSIDFSQLDPTKFASGSDDCSIRLWSINERNSTSTIWSPANVCCVQFSPFSSHLLAFGSADYRIYCYDLRFTKIPWCTIAGHGKAVSYVRFLDSETIISASTDSTLKLWDLKKTCLEGLSQNACNLTFRGHTNEKNFVGLAAENGFIACGSERNEVYAYYRSLPMPSASHNFGCVDYGDDINVGDGAFVSSVCWHRKSEMVAAANSNGCIKILRMV